MIIPEPKADLTLRDKVIVHLFLWLIHILRPWKYEHKQGEFVEAIKDLLKS